VLTISEVVEAGVVLLQLHVVVLRHDIEHRGGVGEHIQQGRRSGESVGLLVRRESGQRHTEEHPYPTQTSTHTVMLRTNIYMVMDSYMMLTSEVDVSGLNSQRNKNQPGIGIVELECTLSEMANAG
jgi:hypothetical protein